MSDHTPYIDFENLPAPSEGFLVTQFLTVRSVARSRAFYSDVLGGRVVLEENPFMISHELESLTMHGFSSSTTWPPSTSE